jgi:Kdo2-lipid IVA lauroyltransferase/acyltransferase
MSRRMPDPIKRLKWRVEWLAQVPAEAIIARLPVTLAFHLGECIGRMLWHTMPLRRRLVIKNLRIALAGEMPPDAIRALARQSFTRSIANLVSAVHTAHMPAKKLVKCVTVENPEVLEAAVRDGSGCVLLPPHMGNWEILARISSLFPPGHPLGALYRPLNNPILDARLAARRQSEGTRMFSKRDSLLEITRFLKTGGIIGILADQRAGPQGVLTNFFGRLTRSSPLPYLLIRRCKVPAFSISVRTVRPGHWALRYHPVPAPGDTQACMDAIETAMRESIIDVFWFQDRWKCYLSRRRKWTPRNWLGEDGAKSLANRHRALIWLSGVKSPDALPTSWTHDDVQYEITLGETQCPPSWVDSSTVVHRIIDDANPLEIQAALRRIDGTSDLPLDFVIGIGPAGMLRTACKREAILFTSLFDA